MIEPGGGEDFAEFGFQVVSVIARLRVVEKRNLRERQIKLRGLRPVMLNVPLPLDRRVAALALARVAATDDVDRGAHHQFLVRGHTSYLYRSVCFAKLTRQRHA